MRLKFPGATNNPQPPKKEAIMQFKIEQLALHPRNPELAIALLTEMGLSEWAKDHVVARGAVRGIAGGNEADLAFNYQATRGSTTAGATASEAVKPLELEVLHYTTGPHWMEVHEPSASHIGMHCSEDELRQWHDFFTSRGIKVAQQVNTQSHTNPHIAGTRWYTYTIYDTRAILGIDTKLIVRRDAPVQG